MVEKLLAQLYGTGGSLIPVNGRSGGAVSLVPKVRPSGGWGCGGGVEIRKICGGTRRTGKSKTVAKLKNSFWGTARVERQKLAYHFASCFLILL